ncbi:hypothetical protein RRG08_063285 [Elysia crispata]|uniref:Ashwin n=1 Tax=Elysia crispata TaxID=231223 RepID=A0AAE1CJP1_9GAST|nr:hypothetical protein RRG08_063285 [Elysia crispata]
MAAPSNNDSSCHDYMMYPDLLSKDGLLHVLQQRYLSCLREDLESLDKEALVDLYNRYILPLPQRTYRTNKRGQQMTRAQKSIDRKRKIISINTGGNNPAAKKPCVEGTSACVINYQSSPLPSGDRLKPPPSGINFEKKLIKLKSDLKTYTNEVKESGDATSSPSKADVESQQNRVGHANAYSRGVKHNISSLNQESGSPKKKKFVPISWP